MLGSGDVAQMRADLLAVRDDNPASITVRRGAGVLAAQSVRIARLSSAGEHQSVAGQETRGRVLVAGATDDPLSPTNVVGQGAVGKAMIGEAAGLDLQPGDRFSYLGILYRVTFVRPNHVYGVQAEAEAIE